MSSIVFTFGRMNPPTIGHTLLVRKVVETARSINSDHIIYLSQTQNNSTDPLDWDLKRRICESAFRGVNISKDKNIRNPFIALETLKENYDNIVMVVGSDQADEFKKRFSPYTEKWCVRFSVITAGQRIAESEGIEGISASILRQYALGGNKEKFFEGLPNTLSLDIKELVYVKTRKGLK